MCSIKVLPVNEVVKLISQSNYLTLDFGNTAFPFSYCQQIPCAEPNHQSMYPTYNYYVSEACFILFHSTTELLSKTFLKKHTYKASYIS